MFILYYFMKKFIVGAIVVALLGGGGYYFLSSGKMAVQNNNSNGQNSSTNSLDKEPAAQATLPTKNLKILTSDGKTHEFIVEEVNKDEDRKRGFMYRKFLDQDKGMLFIFEKAEIQYFWMKDTLIPLDIIFLDESGKVVQIAEKAQPCFVQHCDLFSSIKASRYVVELNGGIAGMIGLKVGDKVSW